MKQRSWRKTVYWLASHSFLNLLSYRTKDHQPNGHFTHKELGPHPSITKKMFCRLAYNPILWKHFFLSMFPPLRCLKLRLSWHKTRQHENFAIQIPLRSQRTKPQEKEKIIILIRKIFIAFLLVSGQGIPDELRLENEWVCSIQLKEWNVFCVWPLILLQIPCQR